MPKKRKGLGPEERAEADRRTAETLSLLQERIDFHRAKLKEEHGPDYEPPTLEEYEAQLRERIRASGEQQN